MAEMGLAEAVAQLRREIVASMAAAKDEAVRFQIGAIELELQVQLATKAGVKGEAKWIVVSFIGSYLMVVRSSTTVSVSVATARSLES